MGGYVLFNLLERFPERVAAALFIVTKAGGDDEVGRARRTALAEACLTQGSLPVAEAFRTMAQARHTGKLVVDLGQTAGAEVRSDHAPDRIIGAGATYLITGGAGGLGEPILSGIQLRRTDLILEGALPAAVLAIAVQGLFDWAERWAVPRGLRPARREGGGTNR